MLSRDDLPRQRGECPLQSPQEIKTGAPARSLYSRICTYLAQCTQLLHDFNARASQYLLRHRPEVREIGEGHFVTSHVELTGTQRRCAAGLMA